MVEKDVLEQIKELRDTCESNDAAIGQSETKIDQIDGNLEDV